jgi:hypothetical protein
MRIIIHNNNRSNNISQVGDKQLNTDQKMQLGNCYHQVHNSDVMMKPCHETAPQKASEHHNNGSTQVQLQTVQETTLCWKIQNSLGNTSGSSTMISCQLLFVLPHTALLYWHNCIVQLAELCTSSIPTHLPPTFQTDHQPYCIRIFKISYCQMIKCK